jgi:hypothetical protein
VGLDSAFGSVLEHCLCFLLGWDKQEEEAERRRKQVRNLTQKHRSPRSICHDMLLRVLTSFLLAFVKYVGIAWMSSLLHTWPARWLNPDHEMTKDFSSSSQLGLSCWAYTNSTSFICGCLLGMIHVGKCWQKLQAFWWLPYVLWMLMYLCLSVWFFCRW